MCWNLSWGMQMLRMRAYLDYDTLVLEKNTDYDTKGTLTPEFSEGRAKVRNERALRAGSEATARRDRAIAEIEDREKRANELQRRNEEEEQARLAEFERAAAQAAIDPANNGGLDPPSVAAMQYEDQQEPLKILFEKHFAFRKSGSQLYLPETRSVMLSRPALCFSALPTGGNYGEMPIGILLASCCFL
jgi:hypothetical protein